MQKILDSLEQETGQYPEIHCSYLVQSESNRMLLADMDVDSNKTLDPRVLEKLYDLWWLDTGERNRLRQLVNQNSEMAWTLLSMHGMLRLLFPHDRALTYRWITARNRHFQGQ